jgi:hypothetical protein
MEGIAPAPDDSESFGSIGRFQIYVGNRGNILAGPYRVRMVRNVFCHGVPGIFTLTGDRYQMTIPRELKIETVKNAFRRIATTERRSMLEERLLITVAEQEAVAWKRRLVALSSPQRLADREALLAE